MLFPLDELEALRSQLDQAGDQLVVATEVDPINLARAAGPLFQSAQLMCAPDGSVVVGLGSAWKAVGSGSARFEMLNRRIESADAGAAPIFMGFGFHPDGPRSGEWTEFGSADALVPQVSIVRTESSSQLVLTRGPGSELGDLIDLLAGLVSQPPAEPFEPGDHSVVSRPSSAEWRTEVEEAVGAIRDGDLSKVVLGRSVIVTTENAPQAFELVDHLRETYPQCFVFAWQAGESTFVGASPELLLEKSGSSLRLNPLAGSARRGEGEADDRAVGEALMHSPKDRREHSLVVEDIATRLEPYVSELSIPAQPSLRRMATVQHLSSEILGVLAPGVSALQLVGVMHPTPAVGGSPRAEALAFVDKIEGLDRGWYTGGIGWLTSAGDATFAIPLRCALLRGRHAHLYAGAGVVADSSPEGELDETRLKFRPMLSVLTAT